MCISATLPITSQIFDDRGNANGGEGFYAEALLPSCGPNIDNGTLVPYERRVEASSNSNAYDPWGSSFHQSDSVSLFDFENFNLTSVNLNLFFSSQGNVVAFADAKDSSSATINSLVSILLNSGEETGANILNESINNNDSKNSSGNASLTITLAPAIFDGVDIDGDPILIPSETAVMLQATSNTVANVRAVNEPNTTLSIILFGFTISIINSLTKKINL